MILITTAYNRESLVFAYEQEGRTITVSNNSFWLYTTNGLEFRLNALTLDNKKPCLVTVSTTIGNTNNLEMKPAFYEILSTLKF